MKRIVTAILSTVTVLVLLFGYHTSTAGPLAAGSATSIVSGSDQAAAGSSGTESAPTTPEPSDSGSSDTGSSNSGSSDSGSSSDEATSFTGAVAQTRWGPVQVQVSVSGGKVSDVSVIQYPSGNGKDQEINSYALPILIQETIQAQSADIDMVSGATVTSDGYLQSLQSALDEAHL